MQVIDATRPHVVTPAQQPKLLDRLRAAIRVKHYSLRTEQAYVHWTKRYILHHGKRHPQDMGAPEVEAFLSHLATDRHVSASTQNQALAALLFLYRQVLGIELPWLDNLTRAKQRQRVPVVLSQQEMQRLLRNVSGVEGICDAVLNAAARPGSSQADRSPAGSPHRVLRPDRRYLR